MQQFFNKKSAEQKAAERKAAINRVNRHGTNAFFNAVESNRLDEVAKLLREGADINARTTARGFISNMTVSVPYGVGATPLHAACLLGSGDIVSFLIGRGAGVNAKDEAGHTPLDYAILSHSYYQAALERKEASKFSLKYSVNKAASRVSQFENVITQLLAHGAKPGMFEMPEKFHPAEKDLPPAPPLP
jgi:ankyrin repeat protein